MNTVSNDSSFPQPRRARGNPDGGQFTAFTQQDQEGGLADDSIPEPASELDRERESDDEVEMVAVAFRRHPSPSDLGRCLEHHQPLSVRLAAVSSRAHPRLTAYAASGDPDPIIRAHALLSPFLDADRRTRLMSDPSVLRAAAWISGDERAQSA